MKKLMVLIATLAIVTLALLGMTVPVMADMQAAATQTAQISAANATATVVGNAATATKVIQNIQATLTATQVLVAATQTAVVATQTAIVKATQTAVAVAQVTATFKVAATQTAQANVFASATAYIKLSLTPTSTPVNTVAPTLTPTPTSTPVYVSPNVVSGSGKLMVYKSSGQLGTFTLASCAGSTVITFYDLTGTAMPETTAAERLTLTATVGSYQLGNPPSASSNGDGIRFNNGVMIDAGVDTICGVAIMR